MINNRQNGRRRGRGGTRPPNGSNNAPERGNRVDSRARGNASQLHEKYKSLARDTQMQGDRVMTEYYLQFADHYFRVLSESRSRFEEQRPRRDEAMSDFDDEDGDGESGGYDERGDYRADDGGQEYRQNAPRQNEARQNEARQNEGRQNEGRNNEARQHEGRDRQNEGRQNDGRQNEGRQNDGRQNDGRRERTGNEPRRREQRPERPERAERPDRGERPTEQRLPEPEMERQVDLRPAEVPAADPVTVPQESQVGSPVSLDEAAPAERPRRTRIRRETPVAEEAAPERIEIDRLPPAFAASAVAETPEAAADGEEEAPRRRRTRRPRTDVAPVEA
ncbi:MAG: hypothetical protein JWL91_1105 [Sphingomonas bacterium]|nr:DUF4167 domain-containing protein [Sphingomonas bacterium]MDB5689229.1 hypothetical protein [Sphingomonas bacterium]